MGQFYRDQWGRGKRRTPPNRNVRRLHLQCQVVHGKALPAKDEKRLRRRLANLLKLEGLTGRRWTRLVEKRTRMVELKGTKTGRWNG